MLFKSPWGQWFERWLNAIHYTHNGLPLSSLRLELNGRQFAYDIFKFIFLKEKFVFFCLKFKQSLFLQGSIDSMSSLVHLMALCCTGKKSFHEPTTTQFTDTCMKADSRFAPSQWETVLLCNDVSHWLGAGLESYLMYASPVLNVWNLIWYKKNTE